MKKPEPPKKTPSKNEPVKKTAALVPHRDQQGSSGNGSGSNGAGLEKLKAELAVRRTRVQKVEEEKPALPLPVSAGPVDKIVDMVFNPSNEKMLEFTVLDRNQTRLIPQLGVVDDAWEYCIEVAGFRFDAGWYEKTYHKPRPTQENLMRRFVFLTAQCQKSLQGTNLKSAIDLALADVETRGQEGDELLGSGHGFED